MKKVIFILFACFMNAVVSAQNQQGIVKTRGRMVNGVLQPGVGLQGAIVQVKDRSAVVSGNNGKFSFPLRTHTYMVQSVQKKGYELVDADALRKPYQHSANPLYLVMETPEQQLEDLLEAQERISKTLREQLKKSRQEIQRLKDENKITEEDYRQRLAKLMEDQQNSQKLIADMAKRYSEQDYDQLDEFYRRVSWFIENGELTRADSLLRTRGNITTQVQNIMEHGQTIGQQEQQLQQAKTIHQADIDEAARRCYCYFESFFAQHRNDSSAYYLALRASLDSTNVKWQLDAGSFYSDYISDHSKALYYYVRAEKNATDSIDFNHIYNNLGTLFFETGHYAESLIYYKKALSYLNSHEANQDKNLPKLYSNISAAYRACNDIDSALIFGEKGLQLSQKILGEENVTTANCHNNLGRLYERLNEFDKAKYHFLTAITALEKLDDDNNALSLSQLYVNIAGVHGDLGEFDLASDYYMKALLLREKILGESHPLMGNLYNNLGYVAREKGDYIEAIRHYQKAVDLWSQSKGFRFRLIDGYGNIASAHEKLGNYEKALPLYEKGEAIVEELYKRGDADAMLFLPNIYMTLLRLAATSDDYHLRYEHYMDDKAVVGLVAKGSNSPAAQQGMAGEYYILEYGNWNITQSQPFFEIMKELKDKPKKVTVMKDGIIHSYDFNGADGIDYNLYYVTEEEKGAIWAAYEKKISMMIHK